MPSPFPGMDPYLEDPNRWESFHSCYIAVLHEMLQSRVRPHFVVQQQTAVYLIEPGGDPRDRPPIKPDIFVVAPEPAPETPIAERTGARTAVIEQTITEPQILSVRYPAEIRQRYLEIRDRATWTIVAMIELLSPTNKDRRGGGLAQFDRKRRDVMASPVHWLEIDLLRAGERPYEVTGDVTRQSDYYALLQRGRGAPMTPAPQMGERMLHAWFFDVRDLLPVVAVPLRPPFPDVALDLQAALATVYARYYEGLVDYARPVVPPLPPADAAWADDRVRAWRAEQPA